MKTVYTKDLEGAALDYAVAVCEGFGPGQYMRNIDVRRDVHGKAACLRVPINREYVTWAPTKGLQGDDIIDREGITTIRCDDDYGRDSEGYDNGTRIPVWAATLGQFGIESSTEHQHHDPMYQIIARAVMYGPTRRVAAMRVFITSRLGLIVEIPDEIL